MNSVISHDGTRISFTHSGQGPLLILLGGALQTKTDRLMGSLIPLLAEDFTVVSYDRRGRGESDLILPYTIEREVEDVEAILKEMGGTGSLFGNSSGGQLALYAASRLAGIRKVAVYEAPFIPERAPGDARSYLDVLEKSLSEGRPGDALKAFFRRVGVPTLFVTIMRVSPMWRGLKALAPTLPHDAKLVGDGTVPSEFGSIAVPVLALTGEQPSMQQAAQRLVDKVPGARQETLTGQSHAVKPLVLATALRRFLA